MPFKAVPVPVEAPEVPAVLARPLWAIELVVEVLKEFQRLHLRKLCL